MRPMPEKRSEARRLRREGMKLRDIAQRLGVSVNSAHRWTADIVLTPEQVKANRAGPPPGSTQHPDHVARRISASSKASRQRRVDYQAEGRLHARQGDRLHIAGCMLYWAEGSKSRNTLCFANSDPSMVRLFCRFLIEPMGVSPADFRIRLNVYLNNGLSLAEIERHWLRTTGATRSSLRGHTLNHLPTSSSGKRRNLPYGVCTVKVAKSTWLVQHIYGAIQEYGGFKEPRWLDGPPRKPRKKTG